MTKEISIFHWPICAARTINERERARAPETSVSGKGVSHSLSPTDVEALSLVHASQAIASRERHLTLLRPNLSSRPSRDHRRYASRSNLSWQEGWRRNRASDPDQGTYLVYSNIIC